MACGTGDPASPARARCQGQMNDCRSCLRLPVPEGPTSKIVTELRPPAVGGALSATRGTSRNLIWGRAATGLADLRPKAHRAERARLLPAEIRSRSRCAPGSLMPIHSQLLVTRAL